MCRTSVVKVLHYNENPTWIAVPGEMHEPPGGDEIYPTSGRRVIRENQALFDCQESIARR